MIYADTKICHLSKKVGYGMAGKLIGRRTISWAQDDSIMFLRSRLTIKV